MTKRHTLPLGLFLCLLAGGALHAGPADRFYIENQEMLTGATGQEVPVRCDNSFMLFAFSLGIKYDSNVLQVNAVSNDNAATTIDVEQMVADADFFDGVIDPDSDGMGLGNGIIGWGCVFDTDGDFSTQNLPAGNNQIVGIIDVDVLANTNAVTTLVFDDVITNPMDPSTPVINVMTNEDGNSVLPATVDGQITIDPKTPEITSCAAGGLEGDVFQVVGNDFDQPGLQVTVCGTVATAALQGDNMTIDVTAPACAAAGPADVVVSTDRGSDTSTGCFDYLFPVIDSFEDNAGREGDQFTIIGANFDQAGLSITVGGQAAANEPPTDGGTRVVVTAPPCPGAKPGTPGFAEVTVTTDFGDAAEVNGFNYTSCGMMGPLQRPADCDQNGAIQLTDGVCVLGHLFRGEPRLLPCGNGLITHQANKDLLDMDRNGNIDLTDAVLVFRYLFASGARPPLCTNAMCTECVEIDGCPDNSERCGA